MKHRSVGIFVVLAALLAAVPQASRDLLDVTGAIGAHAHSGVLRAFLGLQAGVQSNAHALVGRPGEVAYYPTQEAAPNTARKAQQGSMGGAHKARPAAPVQPGELPQIAMLLDPIFDGAGEPVPSPFEDVSVPFGSLRIPESRSIEVRGMGVKSELAMAVPPAPPAKAVLKFKDAVLTGAASRVLTTQNLAPAVEVAAHYVANSAGVRAEIEKVLREMEAEAEIRAAEAKVKREARVKVLRPGRESSKAPRAFDCGDPQAVREASCPAPVAPESLFHFVTLSE